MKQWLKGVLNALRGRRQEAQVTIKMIPYDVTRRQLGSIDPNNVRYIKSMSEEEYMEHIGNIDRVYSNPSFKTELDGLLDAQIYFMGQESQDETFKYGRGTVNGIALVRERFELLSGEYRKKSQPTGKVNPEEMFRVDGTLL